VGFEVWRRQLDYGVSPGTFREWRARGFERLDAAAGPRPADAILFFPSGAPGRVLVTQNFVVLKTYNQFGRLRARGGTSRRPAARRRPVPQRLADHDVQPSRPNASRCRRNRSLGYKVTDFDATSISICATNIRKLQQSFGMTPDGHPSRAF